MTFKEFLEFISQSEGYFIGFLIVFGMATSFIYKIFNSLFKNLVKPTIKALGDNDKKEETK